MEEYLNFLLCIVQASMKRTQPINRPTNHVSVNQRDQQKSAETPCSDIRICALTSKESFINADWFTVIIATLRCDNGNVAIMYSNRRNVDLAPQSYHHDHHVINE